MNLRHVYALGAFVFIVTLSFSTATRALPPRVPFVRSIGATRDGFMFRAGESRDVTCEQRVVDGAVRCIDLRVPSVRAARGAMSAGVWAVVLGGTLAFAGWAEDFACHGDECPGLERGRRLLIGGTALGASGVAALAGGGVLAHRFHHGERRLRLESFTLAPMMDPAGTRAPSGITFRASF